MYSSQVQGRDDSVVGLARQRRAAARAARRARPRAARDPAPPAGARPAVQRASGNTRTCMQPLPWPSRAAGAPAATCAHTCTRLQQAAPRARRVILMPKRKWSSALPANSAACSAGLPAGAPRRRGAPPAGRAGRRRAPPPPPPPPRRAQRGALIVVAARPELLGQAAGALDAVRARLGLRQRRQARRRGQRQAAQRRQQQHLRVPQMRSSVTSGAPTRSSSTCARAGPAALAPLAHTRARQARRPAAPPARDGSDERERRGFVHMGTAKWALGTCPLDCLAIC